MIARVFTIVIILAVGYVVGAKYPQLLGKVGL